MSVKLNLCFCGSSAFSVPFLDHLYHHPKFLLSSVLTRCDQAAHRGKKITPNPIKRRALELNLPILEPKSLMSANSQDQLRQWIHRFNIDAIIVVAYGLMIPASLLTLCPLGWLNVHASLLPRWRGAAPIARAILAGDQDAGISIMQINAGCDTGEYLLQRSCPIDSTDTADSLAQKLIPLGIQALEEALIDLSGPKLLPWIAQSEEGAVYAQKLSKMEAEIDWNDSAEAIERQVRGYYPWPMAWFTHSNEPIRLLKAVKILPDDLNLLLPNGTSFLPGTILANHRQACIIQTGKGALACHQFQFPNHKPQFWQDLRNQEKLKCWISGYSLL